MRQLGSHGIYLFTMVSSFIWIVVDIRIATDKIFLYVRLHTQLRTKMTLIVVQNLYKLKAMNYTL